ncbi:hypothetical protein AAIJ15_002610 [Salmonella enterica]|nr:hypothetical protein [Salmonella enterica]
MARGKDTTETSSPKSDKERQTKRRGKLKAKIGPGVTLHMSDHDKKRLDQVTDKITGIYPPGTHERSRVIAELVNQYYVWYVMHRSGKTAEYIYKKHCEIWEMQHVDEMDDEDIAEFMNEKNFPVPTVNKDGSISLEKREWQRQDVLLYRKTENVIDMIDNASRNKRN